MYDAAVAGAAPGPLTAAALRTLPASRGRVRLIALGKAAHAMGGAAAEVLNAARHDRLVGGLIVAPDPALRPHPAIDSIAGDHPMPGPRSFGAARRLAEECARVRDD